MTHEYVTIVFRFASPDARSAFFSKFFPGNVIAGGALGNELLPGVTVTAMSLSDQITASELYQEALEAIAGDDAAIVGHVGDAWEIACDTLNRVEAEIWGETRERG